MAECICRKEQKFLGKECDRPKETCLGFGEFARYYIDNNFGRSITTEEALKILDLAEESGLILSPTNAQELKFICCCCPCCCPIIKTAKLFPKTKYVVQSSFQAAIDPDLCLNCGLCLERCQVEAIKEGDEHHEVKLEKCIGCGLCVGTCPEQAISLAEKPKMDIPPKDFVETLKRIETERQVGQSRA